MSGTVAVDPSIARGVEVFAPPNPLTTAQQGTGILQGMTAARTANHEFHARQALGEAAQQAIDPATGRFDPAKYRQLVQQNPMAAFMANEAIQQSQEREAEGLAIQQQQAAVGMQRLNNLRQSISGLMAMPSPTRQDVVQAIGNLLALPESERPFSASVAASQLATLPNDAEGIKTWLRRIQATTDEGVQQLGRFLPQPQGVQTGAGTVFTDVNPMTNPQIPGTVLPNQPGPSERSQLVERYNQRTRQMEMVPRQDAAPMYEGTGRQVNPGQQRQSPLGTGRYPTEAPTEQTPGVEPQAAARPQGGAVPGTVPVAPPIGAAEAMTIQAGRAAEQAVALQRQADQAPIVDATLRNMRSLLNKTTTGPGAGWNRQIVSEWNRWMPPSMQINETGNAAQEEFVKLSVQLAQQQFQALGGTGANEQLESAMKTSPNETLSNMGNRNIVALLLGNNDAIKIKNDAFQQWMEDGRGPDTYNQFSHQFNREFDPRVFQMVYLDAESRRALVNGMRPEERREFEQRFRSALEKGWIQLPSMTGGR